METLNASMPLLVFLIIGSIAVASSILVVAMRNPVHSALFLLLTFLCVAVLFVIKAAEFVAAVQVLIYVGGILVLILFAVMLTHRITDVAITNRAAGRIPALLVISSPVSLLRCQTILNVLGSHS